MSRCLIEYQFNPSVVGLRACKRLAMSQEMKCNAHLSLQVFPVLEFAYLQYEIKLVHIT